MGDAKASGECPICKGRLWVCENHHDKAFQDECECGAGMPCVCNREAILGPGSTVLVDESGTINGEAALALIDALRAQLAESESERLEQARLLGMSMENELRLRAQFTEKNREIERLTAANEEIGKALGYPEGLVHTLSTLRADLSASQAREREAREVARINLESARDEAIDRDAMLARAMRAEAREREAVTALAEAMVRAEKAEREASVLRGEQAMNAQAYSEAIKAQRYMQDDHDRIMSLETALAAARKALGAWREIAINMHGHADLIRTFDADRLKEAIQATEEFQPPLAALFRAMLEDLAALNGDSHTGDEA